MMDVFFTYLVKHLSANFNIRSNAAISETMIPFEKNLFCQSMLIDIPLNNFKQVFIASCKTGTPKTNNDFAAMVHCN